MSFDVRDLFDHAALGEKLTRLLEAVQEQVGESNLELRIRRVQLLDPWGQPSDAFGFDVTVNRGGLALVMRGRGMTLTQALANLSTEGIPKA